MLICVKLDSQEISGFKGLSLSDSCIHTEPPNCLLKAFEFSNLAQRLISWKIQWFKLCDISFINKMTNNICFTEQ